MAYYESVTKVMFLLKICIAQKSIVLPERNSWRIWSGAKARWLESTSGLTPFHKSIVSQPCLIAMLVLAIVLY